jgi:hypothetical protein
LSISRRKFLRGGTLVALAAAVPLNSAMAVMGQQIGVVGNQIDLSPQAADPLANYTKATFQQYLNSIFRLSGGIYKPVDVTLLSVTDMLPANAPVEPGKECFTLLFRGDTIALPQGTYTVDHAALGRFALFVVPVGADDNGVQGYLATINRLPYRSSIIISPPGSKRSGVMKPEVTPVTPKARVNQPGPTPTVTPAPSKQTPNKKLPKKNRGDYDLQ